MATQLIAPSAMTVLDEETIAELRQGVRGLLLTPDDPGYDAARTVRNGLIDRHPALIAQPTGTADVVACVNFARERGLLLSVRGGAHNVAGNAVNDGGLVIDLSRMRGVFVDPGARVARAQGGATWGDVDHETQLYGLAVPGGVVSSTGIGGLTIHGGYGHLRRTYGLSLDSLLSVEIVTADGQVRTASATENPDLFWAVRGAGSNFGVITSFEFRLHPVGPVVQLCAPFYALEDGPRVIRAWREFVAAAPDEFNSLLVLWSVPDDEHFPDDLRRRPIVVVAAVYAGPAAEGEQLMQPLRELATPLLDLSGPIPYTAMQAAFDPFFPEGRRYYWKSTYIDELSDEAIDTMVAAARARPSGLSGVTFWHLGGAMSRVGDEETAYGRRNAPYLLTAEASWEDPATDEQNIAWARESLAAMRPFSQGGSYLNFPGFGEEKEAMLRASYGPNYDRLVALKTQYDPGNLFRMNLNIPPRT
ncbi:MAG: linked oxidase domain protein [Thermomicrobiales bacterium]|nr:linked oxidase domain protein [Thermomicrobiales bacterium]